MTPRSPRSRALASSSGANTSAGRVIAGIARGVRLVGPGEGTRPLGDRVKQTLFAILEPVIRGRPFLDLYAGSGSAGIEALSRGASEAVFVESDRKAVQAIQRNLEATGFAGPSAVVFDRSVGSWLAKVGRDAGPFATVILDPPYDRPAELNRTLAGIAGAGRGGILAEDGVVVAKHFWKEPPEGRPLLRSFRQERFGETALSFYRWADDDASQGVD